MTHTGYDTTKPTQNEMFSAIYSYLRYIKQVFMERFGLDHNMNNVQDTSLITADGYHSKVTLSEYSYVNALNETIYTPDAIVGSNILFTKKINGLLELCCRKGNTVYQMTDTGHLATDVSVYTTSLALAVTDIVYGNGLFVTTTTSGIYTSSDLETWTQRSTFNAQSIWFINNIFIVSYYIDDGGYIATSADGITWTARPNLRGIIVHYHPASGLYVLLWLHYIYTTSDFNSMTVRYNPGNTDEYPTDILEYDSVLFAFSYYEYRGTNKWYTKVLRSTDAVTWTQITTGSYYVSQISSIETTESGYNGICVYDNFSSTYLAGITATTSGVSFTTIVSGNFGSVTRFNYRDYDMVAMNGGYGANATLYFVNHKTGQYITVPLSISGFNIRGFNNVVISGKAPRDILIICNPYTSPGLYLSQNHKVI